MYQHTDEYIRARSERWHAIDREPQVGAAILLRLQWAALTWVGYALLISIRFPKFGSEPSTWATWDESVVTGLAVALATVVLGAIAHVFRMTLVSWPSHWAGWRQPGDDPQYENWPAWLQRTLSPRAEAFSRTGFWGFMVASLVLLAWTLFGGPLPIALAGLACLIVAFAGTPIAADAFAYHRGHMIDGWFNRLGHHSPFTPDELEHLRLALDPQWPGPWGLDDEGREAEWREWNREIGRLDHIPLRDVAKMVESGSVDDSQWPILDGGRALRVPACVPDLTLRGGRRGGVTGGELLRLIREELDHGTAAKEHLPNEARTRVLAKHWLFQMASRGDAEAAAILVGRMEAPPLQLLSALLRHPTDGSGHAMRAARGFSTGTGGFPLHSPTAYYCAQMAMRGGVPGAEGLVDRLSMRLSGTALESESGADRSVCNYVECPEQVFVKGDFMLCARGDRVLQFCFGLLDPRFRDDRFWEVPESAWMGDWGYVDYHPGSQFARVAWLPDDKIDIDWERLRAHAHKQSQS